jgi:UrcA family protein
MLARFVIPALLAASLVTPAQAEDPEHTAIVIVDRTARPSHALLRHRIAVAVEEVCGSYSTIESYQWPEVDACRKVAWASANRQLAALPGSGEIRLSSR